MKQSVTPAELIAIRSLKPGQWPSADQAAWDRACSKSGRLSKGGKAAHLKLVSRNDVARRYGQFLEHVWRLHGRLDEAVVGNVTQANVATYIAELRLRVASVTLHGSIAKLRRASEILCPTENFYWLRQIENDLAMDMRPASKFDRMVDSQAIVEAGLALMHWADTAACSQLRQAELYRNGLMIALLAVCPIRLKNFASIEIARNLIPVERSWHIVLQAAETKEGRPDERPLPSLLTPFINRYLEHYRSVFGHQGSALWVGRYHNAMTANAVARILTETTRQLLGKPISPHLFRSCAASTAYFYCGLQPHLASALLNHRGPKTTERHYNRARAAAFGRRYADLIEALK